MKKSSLLLLFISITIAHSAHAMGSKKRTIRRPIHKKYSHAKPLHTTRLQRSINRSEHESLTSFKHYFDTIQQIQESHSKAIKEICDSQINHAHQATVQAQQAAYLSEERAHAWEAYARNLEQKVKTNHLVQPQKAQADLMADIIRTRYCNNDWGIYADLLSTLRDQLKQSSSTNPVVQHPIPTTSIPPYMSAYANQNNEYYYEEFHTPTYNNSAMLYTQTEEQ